MSTSLIEQAFELHRAGDLDGAERLYRQLLANEPNHADAHHLLGVMALQRNDPSAALGPLETAIRLNPTAAEFHSHLAAAWQASGEHERALAAFREAARLAPHSAAAQFELGAALAAAGQTAAAESWFRAALAIDPQMAEAHFSLGLCFEAQQNFVEAVESHRRAIRMRPDYGEAHGALGVALQRLGQGSEAKSCYERALAINPDDITAQFNLATVLLDEGRLLEAEHYFQSMLKVATDHVESLTMLQSILVKRGDWRATLDVSQRILRARPDNVDAHYCLGMARLAVGQFAAGWPEYDWVLKRAVNPFPQPFWTGKTAANERVLVHTKGLGLGDVLQFIRYLPLVEQQGGDVMAEVPAPLMPLLAESGFHQLIDFDTAQARTFERQVMLLSLPKIFGTTLETVPANVPYLRARPELVEAWRARLHPYTGFKIGIVWRGAEGWSIYPRSVPLADFAPLAQLPGVRLFSLQKQSGLEELAELGERFAVVDFGRELDEEQGAFMDTAAIMQHLDLVITCDTATAHLAGGLGVPVWVALLHGAEWRWLMDREDSPWYPSMRLFRQQSPGAWTEVLERMAAELTVLLGRNPR